MKAKIVIILMLLFYGNLFCQESKSQDKAFDFWVGDWTGYYYGKDSIKLNIKNNIIKMLDQKVIQENFEDPNSNFKGTSISVYDSIKEEWHQAWADNQNGYYNFIGEIDGDKRIFKTLPKEVNGNTIVQRMVFYNITKNKFTWDWETSTDNEKTWKVTWQLFYEKAP